MTSPSEDWLDPIFDAVISDAQASGYFEKVNLHEPKRPPRTGLTAGIWVESIESIGGASGLMISSARVVFNLRIYTSMLLDPPDLIDPNMARATSNLIRRYHDDFDFGGVIRNVDLLGAFGVGLNAQSGYLESDGRLYRIVDIKIPCIVNDVWTQVP